ncbi:hypothetical protein GCM10007939_05110 [Amylibacter marinus]|uniref:Uncharacterized protein n=1 Tax=Amylibacter marinus TaxID=1475483 RepID=A0ABQ5VSY0_9RHOB|nr:hypothetical protein [Amylibacter marinus]GLQ34228.1 hypothetical protein GCM10007939_05110 [Amylibacter marinus]
MVYKGDLEIDPRGMIYEAYRMEPITVADARVIFLDWAMEAAKADMRADLELLLRTYGQHAPDHPMTQVIKEGLSQSAIKGRRGGRSGRMRG